MSEELSVGQLFSTPLFSTTLKHVDAGKISALIYALNEAGFLYSGPAVAGLQSQGNLLLIDHPEIHRLRNTFIEVIAAVSKGEDHILNLRGWANLVRQNDLSADAPHNHLPNHWSAVYYPQVPALKGDEGQLIFFDPREALTGSRPVGVAPHTGLFVMFPSWLRHTVVPLRGSHGDRISVSLNAIIGPRPDAPAAAYPPHRMKKRTPGQAPPQEFDPAAPAAFAYPR